MSIYSIALKNIARRKGRMSLIVISLSVSITALVAVITLMQSFQNSLNQELDKMGYTITVKPASSTVSLIYGGMLVSGVQTFESSSLDKATVQKITELATRSGAYVSAKLVTPVSIRSKQGLAIGTNIKKELAVKTWWRYAGTEPADPNDMIIGIDAAKRFHLKTGSEVKLGGTIFKVTAVLHETGSQDDNILFADLATLQNAMNQQKRISLLEIAPSVSNKIDSLAQAISTALPSTSVTTLQQALKYKQQTVSSLSRFGLLITAIIIFISGIIVFMTMAGSVNDRKREIGILRAIGYRSSAVMRIVLSEAAFLSFISGMLGLAAGLAIAYVVPAVIAPASSNFVFNPGIAIGAIMLALVIGVIAGFMPARIAASIDPADALKAL